MKNFAVTGVSGFVAPRHLQAIHATGNRVVAAVDPHDAVGILDRYGFDVRFFTEYERFDRHLEKLRRGPEEQQVHYMSVCAPNYLHDAHCRLGLRIGADVICEKPLVINPWNLDPLEELEAETGGRVYSVLQLRLHPKLQQLRESLLARGDREPREVELTYVTPRGSWYQTSWKGNPEKSGGVAANIGIHFFDLLLWLFGPARETRVHLAEPARMAGYLELERARVRWFLSVDPADLPTRPGPEQPKTYRSITLDGDEIEFTEGFTDLHTRVYEDILGGGGFGIAEARPSIELAYAIRHAPTVPLDESAHPALLGPAVATGG